MGRRGTLRRLLCVVRSYNSDGAFGPQSRSGTPSRASYSFGSSERQVTKLGTLLSHTAPCLPLATPHHAPPRLTTASHPPLICPSERRAQLQEDTVHGQGLPPCQLMCASHKRPAARETHPLCRTRHFAHLLPRCKQRKPSSRARNALLAQACIRPAHLSTQAETPSAPGAPTQEPSSRLPRPSLLGRRTASVTDCHLHPVLTRRNALAPQQSRPSVVLLHLSLFFFFALASSAQSCHRLLLLPVFFIFFCDKAALRNV